MTKDEYEDFALRYKGCGACFPMYHTLSRFEKMWFSAIQKDVAELEQENARQKAELDAIDKAGEHVKQQINDAFRNKKPYWELEKENTLLKGRNEGFEKQIMGLLIKYEGVYKRFPDLKSAMDKAEEVLKENVELKADNDARKFAMTMSEKVEKQLREENANVKEALEGYKKIAKWCDKCDKIAELKSENQKYKDEWQEQVQKATDEGYARTLQTMQLNKAKQFIRDFLAVAIDYIDPIDKNYSLIAEAEQFLKEE